MAFNRYDPQFKSVSTAYQDVLQGQNWSGILGELSALADREITRYEEKKQYREGVEYRTKRDEIEDQQKKEDDRIQEDHYKGVREIQRGQAATAEKDQQLRETNSRIARIESMAEGMGPRQRLQFLRSHPEYSSLTGESKESFDAKLHEMDELDDKLSATRRIPDSRDVDQVDSAMRILLDHIDDPRAAALYDKLSSQHAELMKEQREKQQITQADLTEAFGVSYTGAMKNLVNKHFTKGSLSEEEMEKLIETGGLSAAKEKILDSKQLGAFAAEERALRATYEENYKKLGDPYYTELDYGISDEEFEKFTQLETENPDLIAKFFEQEEYSFGDLMKEGFPTAAGTMTAPSYVGAGGFAPPTQTGGPVGDEDDTPPKTFAEVEEEVVTDLKTTSMNYKSTQKELKGAREELRKTKALKKINPKAISDKDIDKLEKSLQDLEAKESSLEEQIKVLKTSKLEVAAAKWGGKPSILSGTGR